MKYNAVATCLFGLEKIVEFELKKVGSTELKVENGRVLFTADDLVLAKANIFSRTAERILIILHRFSALDFDTLFDEVKSIEWSEVIDQTDVFPVKGYSIDSQLSSVPAMQSVIKKAIVEKLKDKNFISLTEDGKVTKAIRFSMIRNDCLIMLDTSGIGLHKRGYRRVAGEAPIKETLAAGIVDFARVKENSMILDPFCGSATLLIEAALRAKNIAPGINRHFALEDYTFIDKSAFKDARQEAKESKIKHPEFMARGSDIDAKVLQVAEICIKNAGVESLVHLEKADAINVEVKQQEIIVTNPPYGERLMSIAESEQLVRSFFINVSKQQNNGLYIISSNPSFERVVKKEASRRRKLYNGMIECNLYMFF